MSIPPNRELDMSAQALERTHGLENPQAVSCFVQELLNLHRGQGRDILWRDINRCPTEEDYESMVLDSEFHLGEFQSKRNEQFLLGSSVAWAKRENERMAAVRGEFVIVH